MTYYTLANADIVNVPSRVRSGRLNGAKEGYRLVSFIMAGTLIALTVFYIFAINAIVGGAYELRTLNKELEELKNRNQFIEIEAASQRNVSDIQSLAAPLNFVAVDKIEYINIDKDGSFALANHQ
jgi:hypothetical protein